MVFIFSRDSPSLSGNNSVKKQNAPPQPTLNDNIIPDYVNVLGMIFSFLALLGEMKWAAYVAIYCACISFVNIKFAKTNFNDDTKGLFVCYVCTF